MPVTGQPLAKRFHLRRRIGAGGMGEVFEAYDNERRETVALKTLSRADGDTLARFKREFRALQSIAHPNLVSLRELVRDGDQWFFTMELLEGKHFLEHTRLGGRAPTGDGPRFDEAKLRDSLAQLVAGLRTLHVAGLIHRDVKPSNVMVTGDGRLVLLDFGLVTERDPARQSSDGRPVGTVEYMAPEQAAGRMVTEATDWYAVGVMLYEALTGRVPHGGHLLQIMVDKQQVEPVRPDQLVTGLPDDLVGLCVDLLRIEPGHRPDGAAIAVRLGIDDTEARRITTSSLLPSTGVFIGRERELAELARAYQQSLRAPLIQLVIGESGIGKSELVSRFAHLLGAADPDVVTLAGRCYERESVPFKALDGVADGLAHHLAQLDDAGVAALLPARPHHLVRLFPVFQRVDAIAGAAAPRDDTADPLEQRHRMFAALRRVLGKLTERRPVVITIDDLQWADADSFLLLRELLRGAAGPHLLVVATVRSEGGAADMVAERLAILDVGRTQLGPLSVDESLALAEHLAPGVAGITDMVRLTRETGGHPLFLHEILRHLHGQPGPVATPTLDDALWARIGLLQPDARRVLEVVCLAGAPISTEVVRQACRLDVTALGRATASLRVASLARELPRDRSLALEPYHDRVREAVQRNVDAEPRRAHHARIAVALESSGEPRDPQLLLRHFVLAGAPERAGRYAEEAAQRSLDAHAFDQAAALWRTALDLMPGDPEHRRRLRLQLGEALVNAGHGAEAAEHYLEAADGADPATRLECHRNAAEQLLISGRIARGIAALDELLGEIGVSVPPTPRRALLSLLLHRLRLRISGLGFRERHRREIADAVLVRLDVLRAAAHGLAMVDSIRGADFQTRGLLLALHSGHRPYIARALILEAMFQATQSNFKRSHALLERSAQIGGAEPEPYLVGMTAGCNGLIAYFAGRMADSVVHMDSTERWIRQVPGTNWEKYTARIFALFGLRFIGDYVELRRRYESYLEDAQLRGDQYLDSTMRRACVPMWLAEDDPAEAARDLDRARWVPDADTFHVQHFHELVARGEIALYAGSRLDDARIAEMFARLEASMLKRIASIRIQAAYLRGRLAIVRGDMRTAERAARELIKIDCLSAPVWSHLLSSAITLSRGDRAAAADHLERAAAGCVPSGMRLSGAVARWRLAELRGDAGAEQRVAAEAEMTALGARRPDRMAQLLAPHHVGDQPEPGAAPLVS